MKTESWFDLLSNFIIFSIGFPIAIAQWAFEGPATSAKFIVILVGMFLIGSVYFF